MMHTNARLMKHRPIVTDFTATILRGDKVGFLGPNGAGKTTLLKLILGTIAPDSGTATMGTRIEVAYFDQMREGLDLNASLEDYISPGSEWIEINGNRKHVKSYLSDFLFSPERTNSPVSTLSGGERNRLLLARLFARPANVLVLDEPTNDLDIDTLDLLEQLLQDYKGTVFLVSHDRYFLDNVVTSIIANEGDGFWREYEGGYEDWKIQKARSDKIRAANGAAKQEQTTKPVEKTVAKTEVKPAAVKGGVSKLNGKERQELEVLPVQILNWIMPKQFKLSCKLLNRLPAHASRRLRSKTGLNGLRSSGFAKKKPNYALNGVAFAKPANWKI